MEHNHYPEEKDEKRTPKRHKPAAKKFVIALPLLVIIFVTLLHIGTKFQAPLTNGIGHLLARFTGSHAEKVERQADSQADQTQYLLGVGKADITGPVVEINFMGYADPDQIGTGLRQRLHCRSFIVGDPDNDANRFLYMVLDTQSGDTAIRYGILSGLKSLGSSYSMYGQSNVAVVGTHSHSGPGAWLNYLLPDITTLGFDNQSYFAIVDGCVRSAKRAHNSLARGTLSYGMTNVQHANVNRSPYAYLANPASERAQYSHNVDKQMPMLRFTRSSDNKDIGILNWFAVHPTSLYGNNTLVTGDNKGIAADMFEKTVKGSPNVARGFVAGFSQANVGDTSPNILGAYCEDGSGKKCSFKHSLCNGKNEKCHGRGPDFRVQDNGATSGVTIGTRQYEAAKSLYDSWSSSSTPISGKAVRAFHTFQDMVGYKFPLPNGKEATTCAAALGYGFAAGTTDWPGRFDFKQGSNSTSDANPLWLAVRAAVRQPSKEQIKCQKPKPILLDVGEMHTPYDWTPNIVDMQVFRVGQLFIIVSPGEATTMAGRRWRNAITAKAKEDSIAGDNDPLVVLGGPANTYTHYIATPEEYEVQRYEAASTLYGQHTLDAYVHLTSKYLKYLADTPPKKPLARGPLPPNYLGKALDFILPVVFDTASPGKSFGQVTKDAPASSPAGKTIKVSFVGANPRNDLRLESTYALVQKLTKGKSDKAVWSNYKDDSDWELVFHWKRDNSATGTSTVTIEWVVPESTEKGTYRISYFGASKTPVIGTIKQFSGKSRSFKIT